MRTLTLVLTLTGSLASMNAVAADGSPGTPAARLAPLWNWLELSYGINYDSPYETAEIREKSQWGGRATASLKLVPHLVAVGGYDRQHFDSTNYENGPPLITREDFTAGKAGLGTYFGLWDAAAGVLQVTRQERDFHPYAELPGSGSSEYRLGAQGFGYLAGVRAIFGQGAEIAASYEYAPLKGDFEGTPFKEPYRTSSLLLSAPLTRGINFVIRGEAVSYSVETDMGKTKLHNENILLGLRFAL